MNEIELAALKKILPRLSSGWQTGASIGMNATRWVRVIASSVPDDEKKFVPMFEFDDITQEEDASLKVLGLL